MKRYVVFGVGNIGFSIIQELVADAEVFAFDRKRTDCMIDLMQKNNRVSFTEVDATDENSVETALSSCEPESIDGAILTVGISSHKTAFEDMESFRRTVTVNFFGNIVPIRLLVKNKILRKPARIVVIASTSGHFAGISTNAYAPSKWMLVNACQSIRAELAEQGITLDIVNPRTIKNVQSDEFKSSSGIEVTDVTQAILEILRGGGTSRDCFIPKRYGLFHVIERICPWVFDAAKHLPPHVVRKHNYKTVRGTALITGASSGLGREIVKLYAGQCDKIYVTARDIDALQNLKDELSNQCEIVPIQVDFKDQSSVESVKTIIGDQKLDLLINNAGHHVKGSLLDIEINTIKNTMMVNFFTPVALINVFPNIPTVVNVLSTTAIAGRRNLGVYSSSKAGLWCFSKVLRRTQGKIKNVIDVIPATFKSSLTLKGEKTASAKTASAKTGSESKFSSANDGLNSMDVARMVKQGIDRKKDVIYIPRVKTRLFLVLEAFAPNTFRKLFQ